MCMSCPFPLKVSAGVPFYEKDDPRVVFKMSMTCIDVTTKSTLSCHFPLSLS